MHDPGSTKPAPKRRRLASALPLDVALCQVQALAAFPSLSDLANASSTDEALAVARALWLAGIQERNPAARTAMCACWEPPVQQQQQQEQQQEGEAGAPGLHPQPELQELRQRLAALEAQQPQLAARNALLETELELMARELQQLRLPSSAPANSNGGGQTRLEPGRGRGDAAGRGQRVPSQAVETSSSEEAEGAAGPAASAAGSRRPARGKGGSSRGTAAAAPAAAPAAGGLPHHAPSPAAGAPDAGSHIDASGWEEQRPVPLQQVQQGEQGLGSLLAGLGLVRPAGSPITCSLQLPDGSLLWLPWRAVHAVLRHQVSFFLPACLPALVGLGSECGSIWLKLPGKRKGPR